MSDERGRLARAFDAYFAASASPGDWERRILAAAAVLLEPWTQPERLSEFGVITVVNKALYERLAELQGEAEGR